MQLDGVKVPPISPPIACTSLFSRSTTSQFIALSDENIASLLFEMDLGPTTLFRDHGLPPG